MSIIHKPVLVQEVLEFLQPENEKTYLDVTFGSGGHTQAILQAAPKCKVIALDWDTQALDTFGKSLQEKYPDRLRLIWGNFAHLYKMVRKENIQSIDGILADFGTSQVQLLEKEGFSFYKDTPLDMRMSPSHQKITAAYLLNKSSQDTLADIFFEYGQERYARKIAQAIIEQRARKPFETTRDLASLIEKMLPFKRNGIKIHPATKVFQALRIYINAELDNIRAFLPAALNVLNEHGRLVCISFHSLEDSLVKDFFNEQAQFDRAKIVTRKAIVGTEQEIKENPSARSAKLRALEKI